MSLAITAGLVIVVLCVLIPVLLTFSGAAFLGITAALLLQGRGLRNQREELRIAQEEQARGSEVAMRELHTDLIKMAIADSELRSVWPALLPGSRRPAKTTTAT